MSNYELIIQNSDAIYYPVVEGSVSWEVDRFGTPGKLTFSVLNDEVLNIEEGNAVRFRSGDKDVFYGFIFKISGDDERLSITAYDQLRYLKNKDTLIYKVLTADGLVRKIASMFNLQVGTLANTGYVIPPRIEDKQTLIDMIKNALDLTTTNTNKMYVLYDTFGKITLTDIEAMRLDLILDHDTASEFKVDSSIDSNTYNRIKLTRNNKDTGLIDVYEAKDSRNINRWGTLQYTEALQDGENGQAKADALLKLYNQRDRVFTADNVAGDLRVRGGSSIVVQIKIGTISIKNYMVVDSVKHTFDDNEHFMSLKLRGGSA